MRPGIYTRLVTIRGNTVYVEDWSVQNDFIWLMHLYLTTFALYVCVMCYIVLCLGTVEAVVLKLCPQAEEDVQVKQITYFVQMILHFLVCSICAVDNIVLPYSLY